MTITSEIDRRFREAAAAEGLLDVAYDLADTPIGPLLLAATPEGICRISFDPEPEREPEPSESVSSARCRPPEVSPDESPATGVTDG